MPSAARTLTGVAGIAAAAAVAFLALRDGALAPSGVAERADSTAVANGLAPSPALPPPASPKPDSSGPDTTQPEAPPAPSSSYEVRGVDVAYAPFSVFALPGERLAFRTADSSWTWTAPSAPGPVTKRIGEKTLTVFVLEPFDTSRDTVRNGYTIGRYAPARRPGDASAPPAGMLRVSREMADLPVSPSFRLRDFFCRQQPDHWPKYVLLDERLLLKLERLSDAAKARGYGPIRVMSGYRTPWYNRSIGNETTYSHHLFGRAADVYVDANRDGTMDDLDGDGQVTEADAQRLEALVLALDGTTPGGTGLYAPAAHRGPFVHVDVGGRASRWAQ